MPDVKFSNLYPYTDFHELNLDWVIKEVKFWSERVGKSIQKIELTGTVGLVDTYTITYSDGTTSTFDVTNGNGIASVAKTGTAGLVDTYTITFTNGNTATFNVTNGKGIVSVAKTGTAGLVDTYTITYSDGSISTFEVNNGTASIDNTLTKSGWAADAKAAGDAVNGAVNNIINKAKYAEVIPQFVNGRGYSYTSQGVNPQNAWVSNPARATALVNINIGSKIKFNGSLCGVNYYVVGGDVDEMINTPDTWNYSGEIVISRDYNYKYVPKSAVIIIIRKPDNTAFSDADLASVVAAMTIENNLSFESLKTVDVMIFAGQSNIAGRGVTNAAHPEGIPSVEWGRAFEYKAISEPTNLYALKNNFGKSENKPGYIDDGNMKTGSLVPAFANAYHDVVGSLPLICVSASKGGTVIADWKTTLVTDAVDRLTDCLTYLASVNIEVRHIYVVWCQGESDGDNGTTKTNYVADFNSVMNSFESAGVEKCLMIRIGNCNAVGAATRYTNMIEWQTEIAQTEKFVVMVSCDFAGMRDRGMMKDDFHYYQDGYNECGTYAGVNAGVYAATGKEQTMYDTENGDLYYSHKN